MRGERAGKLATLGYQLLDYYETDTGISAMMRTTGFSLSITGQMQLAGRAGTGGVYPAFEAIPADAYMAELRERGIVMEVTE